MNKQGTKYIYGLEDLAKPLQEEMNFKGNLKETMCLDSCILNIRCHP